jgi:hypothetical protein
MTNNIFQLRLVRHGGAFGKIITCNIFRLVNTCIEYANELRVIDGINSEKMSAAKYTELVNKLIADPILRDILK